MTLACVKSRCKQINLAWYCRSVSPTLTLRTLSLNGGRLVTPTPAMDAKAFERWADTCAKTGCHPGFVAVSLCNLDGDQVSRQIPKGLAKLLIEQGRLEDCELFVKKDNLLFNVLLAEEEVERQPGDSDDDHNQSVALTFDVLKMQLPEDQRVLVGASETFERFTPLGIPQMLIFVDRD